jgi:hypothetical protein
MRCNSTANTLVVTEGVIDQMSVMSLFSMLDERYTNYCYLSLCGTGKLPALYLERDSSITTVFLALNNDEAGLSAMEADKGGLAERGINVEVVDFLPPEGKDWNDFLRLKKDDLLSKKTNFL